MEVKVYMFETGSYIMYGKTGVCKVKAVGEPQLSGIDTGKLYYTVTTGKTDRKSRGKIQCLN